MKKPDLKDRVFILEIDAKPVLAFVATTMSEAMELSRESWLRDDFRELESGGAPLWDGRAKIAVRSARTEEAASYQDRTDEMAAGDELGMLYLIELDAT